MIKIAVCDDDSYTILEVEKLLRILSKLNSIKIGIDTYKDGSTLQEAIASGEEYELIYLDIEMKQDGIVTAQRLRDNGMKSLIIYMSCHDKYIRQLFDVGTMRFLDKPINQELFTKYFLIAVEQINKNQEIFTFKSGREQYKVEVKSILYFESKVRMILIYLVNGMVCKYYGVLNDVEVYFEKLGIPFLRPHQSFLVNYKHIFGCGRNGLELTQGVQIPISEDRKKKVESQYGKLLGKDIFND